MGALGTVKVVLAIVLFGVGAAFKWLLSLFTTKPKPWQVIKADVSRFQHLEGFPGKFMEVEYESVQANMHYIDTGGGSTGHTVLCLHGEPTWSYLYRKMIKPLKEAGHRVVAPDFLGFGISDKLGSPDDYSMELHLATLSLLIEHLDLQNVTLVVQDWGGLTGLSLLPDIETRISHLVIMNTGLPPAGKVGFRTKLNFLAWRLAVSFFGQSLPVKKIMQASCKGISEEDADAYMLPFPTPAHAAGAAKWPLLVPLSPSDHVAKFTKRAQNFLRSWSKPCLVMFSDKCPVTRGVDKYFEHLIPTAGSGEGQTAPIIIKGAGHFLQEDAGEVLAANINAFLR